MKSTLLRRRPRLEDDLALYRESITPQVVTVVQEKRQLHHQPDVYQPATSATVLAQLRADDAVVAPTAIRKAFDSRTWLPSLRSVPLAPRPSLADPEHYVADASAHADAIDTLDAIRAVHESADADGRTLVAIALARIAALLQDGAA